MEDLHQTLDVAEVIDLTTEELAQVGGGSSGPSFDQ